AQSYPTRPVNLIVFVPAGATPERATRAEINEVAAIDKLIANLRVRRETITNRVNMRTQVWVDNHHLGQKSLSQAPSAHSTSLRRGGRGEPHNPVRTKSVIRSRRKSADADGASA